MNDTMTPADLLEKCRAAGLPLTTDQETFDQTGLDFRVVHARDDEGRPWIVRTPRRPDVTQAALVEARVLAFVGPRLPVPVPRWRIHTPEVIAYARLPGVPAIDIAPAGGGPPRWNLDPAALPARFLDTAAATYAALQRLSVDEAAAAGVPSQSIDEARAEQRRFMEDTRDVLAPSEKLWAAWQRWLDDDRLWPARSAVVHGDLHPGHMLLGADDDAGDGQALVGVLDWTEAKVTEPSVDFAMFYGCFGADALRELVHRCEQRGASFPAGFLAHAQARWRASPAAGAAWAQRTGQLGVLDHTRAMLATIEDDLARE